MPSGSSKVTARVATESCAGFTYIGLLIAVVVLGVGLSVVGTVSHTLQLRDKERDLLFVGDQFRRAIAEYYEKSPGGLRQYPKKLEELLRDNRYPGVQRYLRKVYIDPLTGKDDWGLVQVPGIGITGVYSKSEAAPLKSANFPALYESFKAAKKYSDWKFVYLPGQAGAAQATTAPAAIPSAVPAPSAPK